MIIRGLLRYIPLVLLASLVAGCTSSSQMSRIDANRALYESWPLDMQQAVLDGRVEPGMTPDMVRMTLGKPTEITSRSSGGAGDEVWVYRKGGDDGGLGLGGLGGPSIGLGGSLGGVNVGTGSGMGTSIGTGIGTNLGPNIGMGTSIGTNLGMGLPAPSSPVEEREVVFQDGVVLRADPPP
jgi:hypothetical protein